MPVVPTILEMRQRRSKKARRSPFGKVGLGCGMLLSICLVISIISLAFVYADLTKDLPSIELLPQLLSPSDGLLIHPTQLFDRSGQHLLLSLENPAAAGHEYLPIDPNQPKNLSPALIVATVAVSDPGFWSHPGFLWRNLGNPQPSTLAERLVSGLLLWDEKPRLRHSLRTHLLAIQVTARFGRNQVLEWFLNNANYGHLSYGADAAARAYLGKPASQLNLPEAALLAAVAEAPALNPIDAPQAARERQIQAIQTMLASGLITAEQANQANQTSLQFQPGTEWASNPAPAFTQLVLRQLAGQFGWERLERGGLRIITTLDYPLQNQITCATQAHLVTLRGQNQNPLTSQGAPCEAAQLLPTLTLEWNKSSQPSSSSISVGADVVVLDPHTGQVLAIDSDHPPAWETALENGRPIGTLLTPFVYLTSFTRGLNPASLVWDIPSQVPGTSQDIPDLDKQHDGPMRLRNALANDELVPAVSTLAQIGVETFWRTARQLGLVSIGQPSGENAYKILWQGGKANLLQIVQAFGVFDNQGILAGQILPETNQILLPGEPSPLSSTTVLKVTDLRGNNWLDWTTPQTRPVISNQLAYLITNVLSDEAARWRTLGHPNHLEIGRPVGAKIGQTLEGHDVWAVGYTPTFVVGVWIGDLETQANQPLPVSTATALWHAIMQYASRNQTAEAWATPDGITTLEVCDPSGLLPTKNCPNIVSDVFLSGTEPTRPDNLYRVMEINRETGRLATIVTPPDLIEERVYLIVPPYATEWARQTNLPLPPENYDTIYSLDKPSPNIQIIQPAMLAYVGRQVSIRGSAAGDNFAFYRLQVGQGLNPQQWVQIGADRLTQVKEGELAQWDTTGLNGLYVLQLLVVRQDQSVNTATIQIAVDNQPPEVKILYPANGQELRRQASNKITLQASVIDNLALGNVIFRIDQRRLATLIQPPYAVPWEVKIGVHTLEVEVADRAGNTSTIKVKFIVTP